MVLASMSHQRDTVRSPVLSMMIHGHPQSLANKALSVTPVVSRVAAST